MGEGPLSDLLVLDLTRALAGPHAGMMLGERAEVARRNAILLMLQQQGAVDPGIVEDAMRRYEIDPESIDPLYA